MLKILGIVALGGIIFLIVHALVFDGDRYFYCLSDDKCLTVWKMTTGETYIIFGEYKSRKVPSDNYIKTPTTNALTIIVDDLSDYDYIISNDYGEKVTINASDYKVKFYEYNEMDDFENKYYTNKVIKKHLKYIKIDIKEGLVVINGVKL